MTGNTVSVLTVPFGSSSRRRVFVKVNGAEQLVKPLGPEAIAENVAVDAKRTNTESPVDVNCDAAPAATVGPVQSVDAKIRTVVPLGAMPISSGSRSGAGDVGLDDVIAISGGTTGDGSGAHAVADKRARTPSETAAQLTEAVRRMPEPPFNLDSLSR